MDFLLQHIHRYIGVYLHVNGFLLRFRKGFLIDLLVLIQRDGINLHGNGWHHIWWFLVEDEVVQRLDIYLLVADNIGRDELTASFLVERLHRGIFDT